MRILIAEASADAIAARCPVCRASDRIDNLDKSLPAET